jgi:protein CpxP
MMTMTMTTRGGVGWRITLSAAVVALAGMACTVALGQTPPGPPPGAGAAMHGGPGMGWDGGWGWGHGPGFGPGMGPQERMLDLAGASAEQKAKVREIFAALRKEVVAQFESGRAMHQQMGQLLLAPKLDAAAVESLRQKLVAQHDAASKRVTQALLDASAVLTPEQRGKLAQAMQQRREMMERHRRERQSLDAPRG